MPDYSRRYTLKDGTMVGDPRLGRLPDPDPADRDFPVRALFRTGSEPVDSLWTCNDDLVMDQGVQGACVGFSITHELRFNPVPLLQLDADFARESIYWPAQRADGFPGGAYPGAKPHYDGTSVRAGIKIAVSLGFYGEYRWAFTEPEVALALSLAPVVLGLNWYEGMMKPNRSGYIKPTGAMIGGHAILCIGINTRYRYYTLFNSWGPDWGRRGTCKISRAHMARLLAENGEACMITERYDPPAPGLKDAAFANVVTFKD